MASSFGISAIQNPSQLTQPSEEWIYSVAFNPDGSILASISADGLILWDISDLRNPSQITLTRAGEHSIQQVESAASSHGGYDLAFVSEDGNFELWRFRLRENSQPLEISSTIRIRIQTLVQTEPGPGHSDSVESVAFNHDGSILASASDDHTIILWDLSDPQNPTRLALPLTEHRADVASVAFNHDGSILASGSVDGTIILWDFNNPQDPTRLAPPLTEHSRGVASVAFNHDGSILASGSWDSTIIPMGSIIQTES
ncbi:MAG: hypothetical protein U5L04_01360 [Trueperaceae bacterium]|nr:hypothetical protein [Trueperaceae bacterium]